MSNTRKTSGWADRFEDLTKNFKNAVFDLAKSLNIRPSEVSSSYNSGKLKPALAAHYKNVPARVRSNDSPTAERSEQLEKTMNHFIYNQDKYVKPNMAYAIPYISELEITIPGVGRTTTNTLDSLAKYAVEAKIPLHEAIGLGAQETALGAQPLYNYKNIPKNVTEEEKQEVKDYNRALGNASYFRNYGVIPAENLVRDFRYNIVEDPIDRNMPPLLHAFTYWKRGNYNIGDSHHTEDVRNKGKAVMQTKAVQNWIKNSEFARRALQTNK